MGWKGLHRSSGLTAKILAYHKNASGVSADPQVKRLVDQIRDLTRRDLLTPAAPSPEAASGEPSSGEESPPSGGGASPKTGGLSPAPVLATVRRGTTIRNNRLLDPTSSCCRHAAPAERFQSSTLHELRQLRLYTNTDTPDIVHQLSAVHRQHVGAARRRQPHLQCSRKSITLRYFYVQKLMEEGKISIH